MSGSYRQCSECGKRALAIATRCPGCGREFAPGPEPRRDSALDLGRFLPLLAGAVALAAVVVLAASVIRRPSPERAAEDSSSIAAPRLEVASVAASPAGNVRELRVARTWTHVRNRRSVTGDVEAVLLPGDTVLADSLRQGWYRVALEGEILGYAHGSTLVADSSTTSP